MNAQRLFATLVVCQAAHSIEEATFGLYELLPYFTWIDTPIPGGARVAFIVGNAAFVLFGGWCYFARAKPGAPSGGERSGSSAAGAASQMDDPFGTPRRDPKPPKPVARPRDSHEPLTAWSRL